MGGRRNVRALTAQLLKYRNGKRRANEEIEKAKKMKSDIQSLRDSELEKAKSQALKITEQAKREAYALLNELDRLKKEQAKQKDAAEMARRARAAVKRGISAIDAAADPVVGSFDPQEDYTLPRELKVGDTVILADIGSEATVISLPDKKGNVGVQMGSIKTRTPIENIRLVEKSKKPHITKPRSSGGKMDSRMNISAETRLDLRGMTVEECLMTLDRFIDTALRTGLNEFTVIHGKGTGALRTAVREYLKKSPYVKSHRLGTFGEGEDGVSIVTLK